MQATGRSGSQGPTPKTLLPDTSCMSGDACDGCDNAVSDALARTVRLTVDRAEIDAQRLCPECFAEWINRYESEMRAGPETLDEDSEIIVD